LSPTHLLVINYAMDEKSQVFSHQVEVVNKLADKYDQVSVLTGLIGTYKVSSNVKVFSCNWIPGKRFTSLFRFMMKFLQLLGSNKFTCIFSHMTSVQSTFISPITRVLRIRHYLWYAHTSDNIYLQISRQLTNGIITSTPGSCPIKGRKVYAIGQSVDSKVFDKKLELETQIIKLIHIGRFDPSKNIESIVAEIKQLKDEHPGLKLNIIGSPSSNKFQHYMESVKSKFMADVQIGWLTFTPAIERIKLPNELKKYDCFVHAFQGSLDKTLVEATLAAIPVVTVNKEYLKIFGKWSNSNSDNQITLTSELGFILNLDAAAITKEVDRRYEIARTNHDMEGWINRLVNVLEH
jgi:glycosyltransferase involved in cell wall biosynthesis